LPNIHKKYFTQLTIKLLLQREKVGMRGIKYVSSQISFNLFVLTSLENPKELFLNSSPQPSPSGA